MFGRNTSSHSRTVYHVLRAFPAFVQVSQYTLRNAKKPGFWLSREENEPLLLILLRIEVVCRKESEIQGMKCILSVKYCGKSVFVVCKDDGQMFRGWGFPLRKVDRLFE